MKKKVFCNSLFELQSPFVTHCISTPMSAIKVAWVTRNATHYIEMLQL